MEIQAIVYTQLIAHWLGDYYLQSGSIAQKKATSYFYTFLHSLLYALPFYGLWALYGFAFPIAWYVHLCAWSHMLIDLFKVWCSRRENFLIRNGKVMYVVDQLLHIGVILVGAYVWKEDVTSLSTMLCELSCSTWRWLMLAVFAYQPLHVSYCILFTHSKITNAFAKERSGEKLIWAVCFMALYWLLFEWI